MGDVGGLHDALVLLGEVIMTVASFFTGSGLDRYLVASLFKVNSQRNETKTNQNKIASRKPAKFSLCNFICSCRDSISAKSYGRAVGRVRREIDIVTFLRHQMLDDIARRVQFSKMERYLIRN